MYNSCIVCSDTLYIAVEGYFMKEVTLIGRLLLLIPPVVIFTNFSISVGFIVMAVVLVVNTVGK